MRTEYTLPNRYRKYPLLEQFMDAKVNNTSQISFFSGNNPQSETADNLISNLEHEISNNNWTVGLGGVKLDYTILTSKKVPKHVKQIYDLCRSQNAAEQKIIDIKAVLEDTKKPANNLVFILNKLNFWGILSELRILRAQKTQAFYDKTLSQLTM